MDHVASYGFFGDVQYTRAQFKLVLTHLINANTLTSMSKHWGYGSELAETSMRPHRLMTLYNSNE